MRTSILYFLFAFVCATTCYAQLPPSNDECSQATELTVNVGCLGKLGVTVNATGNSPSCDTLWKADDDVWYSFTATKTSMLLTVVPSEFFDAAVEVFAKGCDTLQPVLCHNRRFLGETEKCELTGLQIGKKYMVRVYHIGNGFGSGAFTICVSTPTIDVCEGALEIFPTSGSSFVYQDVSLVGAALDASYNCSSEAAYNPVWPDVWLKFTATSSFYAVSVPVVSGRFYPACSVYDGPDCDSLRTLLCGPNFSGLFYLGDLIVGKTYYIRVASLAISGQPVTSFQVGIRAFTPVYGESFGTAIAIPSVPYKNDTTVVSNPKPMYPGVGFWPGQIYFPGVAYGQTGYKIFKINVAAAPVSYYFTPSTGARVCSKKPEHPFGPGFASSQEFYEPFPYSFTTPGDYYILMGGNASLQIDSFPKQKLRNDSCTGAIPITVTAPNQPIQYMPVNFYGATEEGMGCVGRVPDVWYSFVAKNDTLEFKDQDAADVQFYWEVYKGSCDNLHLFNRCGPLDQFDTDPYQIHRRPRMTGFTVGETYYLRATSTKYLTPRQIAIKEPDLPLPPNTNDSCTKATVITVRPKTSNSSFSHSYILVSRKPAGSGCAPSNYKVAWFTFTSPYPVVDFAVSTIAGGPAGYYKLFTGSCGNLSEQICDTAPRIKTINGARKGRTLYLTPGLQYYLAVYTDPGALQQLQLTINLAELDTTTKGRFCHDPHIIHTLPFGYNAFQVAYHSDPYSCSESSPGNFTFFRFTTTQPNTQLKVTLRWNSDAAKYQLYFNQNCACNGAFDGLVSNAYATLPPDSVSKIITVATAGTWYIVAKGYSATEALNFSIAPYVPPTNTAANDKCINAVLLSSTDSTGTTGTLRQATYTQGVPNNPFSSTNLGLASGYENAHNVDVWYTTTITDANFNIRLRNLSATPIGLNITRGDCGASTLNFAKIVMQPGETERTLKIREMNWALGSKLTIRVFAQAAISGTGNFNLAIFPASVFNYPTACPKVIPVTSFPFDSGIRTTCGKGDFSNMHTPPDVCFGQEEVFSLSSTGKRYYFKLTGPKYERTIYSVQSCALSDVYYSGNSPQFSPTFTESLEDTAFFWSAILLSGLRHFYVDHKKGCAPYRLQIWDAAAPNDKCSNAKTVPAQTGTLTFQEELFERVDSNDLFYKFVPATRNGVFYVVGRTKIKVSSLSELQARFYSQCPGGNSFAYLNNNVVAYIPYTTELPAYLRTDYDNDTIKYVFNQLTPGQTYWVRVSVGADFAPYSGGGLFKLAYQNLPFPANDDCISATPLTPSSGISYLSYGSILANPSTPGCNGNADDDVWFRFTAQTARTKIFVGADSTYNPAFELFSGSCASLTSLACVNEYGNGEDESLEQQFLIPGNTYYLRVYHAAAGWGTGKFRIAIQNMPAPPANDQCTGAVQIISSVVCQPVVGTTANAARSMPACSGSEAADVWFRFTATHAAHQIRVQSGTNFDAVVQAFSGSCSNPIALGACHDSTATASLEILKISGLTPGQTYYFRVYNYPGKTGTAFTVCVVPDFSLRLFDLSFVNNISTYCTPAQVTLQFKWYGDIRSDNQFKLQLSDSSGAFGNPFEIGVFSGTAAFPTQTISGNLPTVSGNHYKLRVVSTNLAASSNEIGLQAFATPTPPVTNPVTAAVCQGSHSPILHATGQNLRWYSSPALSQVISTADSLKISTLVYGQRKYYITQTNGICTSEAAVITVNFSEKPATPVLTLPNGNAVCPGDSLQILASGSGLVSWQDGSSGTAFWAKTPGTYKASIVNAIGCKSDTVAVLIGSKTRPSQPIILATVNQACSGDSIKVQGPVGFALYRWSTGSTQNQIWVHTSSTVFLQIADTSGCFSAPSDSISISFFPKPDATLNIQSGANICEGDTIRLSVPLQANVAYSWMRNSLQIPGADSNQIAVTQTGTYQARVASSECASLSALDFVEFLDNPPVSFLFAGGQLIVTNGVVAGAQYVWLLNGIPVDTTQTPLFIPEISGSYVLSVLFPNGCVGTSASQMVTSVSRSVFGNMLRVFPNPTQGKLLVECMQPVSVRLFSVEGKMLLKTELLTSHLLEMNPFGAGIYFLEVENGQGKEVHKVVVE